MISPREILRILKRDDVEVFNEGWHIQLFSEGELFDCRWSEYQQAVEKLRKTQ